MTNRLGVLSLFFLFAISMICEAKPFKYLPPQGWHWYNERQKPPTNLKQSKQLSSPAFGTATEALAFQKKIITEAKAQAVMDPTPEHIRLYRYLQTFVLQKASIFTANWKKVSLIDPSLDFTASHPTASAVQPVLHQQTNQREEKTINALKHQFILTYIYKSHAPLESNFETTIKRFATGNNWPLKEIDLDDGSLMQQPGAQAVREWIASLALPKTPALLLVNPHTQETFPLAFGYIAQTALARRCSIWLSEIQNGGQHDTA